VLGALSLNVNTMVALSPVRMTVFRGSGRGPSNFVRDCKPSYRQTKPKARHCGRDPEILRQKRQVSRSTARLRIALLTLSHPWLRRRRHASSQLVVLMIMRPPPEWWCGARPLRQRAGGPVSMSMQDVLRGAYRAVRRFRQCIRILRCEGEAKLFMIKFSCRLLLAALLPVDAGAATFR